ncbi:MAG: T9SS type A sorting domain-containing protein, partial [Cyclobacteriaceae bacterium]|nr:T9SS type A sorting domain-containing protein [Cyclobacteriaceae bacterium]
TNGTQTYSSLNAGTYTAKATDALGCVATTTATITQPTALSFASGPTALAFAANGTTYQISCDGGSNGEVSVNASGGIIDTYTYQLLWSTNKINTGKAYNNTTQSFRGLTANTYLIKVIDGNKCTLTSGNVSLVAPPPVILPPENVLPTHPQCIGGNDGQVDVTASGGVGPYDYSINNALKEAFNDINTATFSNLSATAYSVNVTDSKGCKKAFSVNIPTNPVPLDLQKVSVIPPICPGTPTGKVSLKAINGILDPGEKYQYTFPLIGTLEGGAGETVTFENVPSGIFEISVSDGYSPPCTDKLTVTVPVYRTDRLQLGVNSKTMPSCFGYDDGGITVEAFGGDAPYQFSVEGTNFLNDENDDHLFSINNLAANEISGYTLYVRDANAQLWGDKCQTALNIKLGEPLPLAVTDKTTNISCFGGTDGAIEAIPGGGSPGYLFKWTALATGTIIGHSATLAGLEAGNYSVNVTDANSCPPAIETFTVDSPAQLRFESITTASTSCTNMSDGTVMATALGGSGDYVYALNSQSNYSGYFGDLAPGEYTLEVNDQKGCTARETIIISEKNISLVLHEALDISCMGSNDGYISVMGSKGQPPYEYALNGGEFTPLNTFFSLYPGTHQIMVRDVTGCEGNLLEVELSEPDVLSVSLEEIQPAHCQQANGWVSVSVTGGAAPYTLEWYDLLSQKVDANNLLAGDYQAVVTDAGNCATAIDFSIPHQPPHFVETLALSPAWCGQANGSASVVITGGSGNFDINWSSGEFTTTASFLPAGLAEVNVTDLETGCIITSYVGITEGPALSIAQNSRSATCGMANGALEISVTGGSPPYQFYWHDSYENTSPFLEEIAAGIYPITIRDAKNCELTFEGTVANINGPELSSIVTTDAFCGLPNGRAAIEISGGETPYQYRWNSGAWQHNSNGEGLPAGRNILEVKDAKGCLLVLPVNIGNDTSQSPTLSLISATPAYCEQKPGTAKVEMTGGSPPYEYYWTDLNETTGPEAAQLPSGTYNVQGTDSNGCSQNLGVIIEQAMPPQVKLTNIIASQCGGPNGSATVEVTGNTGPFSLHWSNGLTGASQQELSPGEYSVYALDTYGCASENLEFNLPDIINDFALYVTGIIRPSCSGAEDGEIEVATEPESTLQFSWDDAANQTTPRATGLPAGEYTVTATNDAGCQTTLSITLDAPETITVGFTGLLPPVCAGESNGSIEVLPTGGTPPYTYVWSDNRKTNKIDGLSAGEYTVTITDARGCSTTEAYILHDPEKPIITGLPEKVVLCEGQSMEFDAGMWQSWSWSSDNGYIGNLQQAELQQPGTYWLEVTNSRGCIARDTFQIEVRNDLLSANFLMASEAWVGDTIVAVDISWPVPEQMTWETPEQAEIIQQNDAEISFVIPAPGNYPMALHSALGKCKDSKTKEILIKEIKTPSGGRIVREGIESFKLYPNPNQGQFTVEVALYQPSEITLSVIALATGHYKYQRSFTGNDYYIENIHLQGLTSGIYALKIEAGKDVRGTRFMIK